MQDTTTTITDPTGGKDARTFTFDYSYWSFDGYTVGKDGVFTAESRFGFMLKFDIIVVFSIVLVKKKKKFTCSLLSLSKINLYIIFLNLQ